ncbi:MAG: histidine phosphotransferase family protein [Paracoccaceae bacterium]
MTTDPTDLTSLLGSRICHDLISPLGAIGNGVELLGMTAATAGPEVALIAESVNNANARIRFFRIAYGAAERGHAVARREVLSVLEDVTRGGRLSVDWQVPGDVARPTVKLAFLALQCMETALPFGGRVTIGSDGPAWRIEGHGEKLRVEPALWSRITERNAGTAGLAPAHVQFALLPAELARQGLRAEAEIGPARVTISY